MFIMVRAGVEEMLSYLSDFCTFYVYSHGLKPYITEVLKLIDPEMKYFKDRDRTVLAPADSEEQQKFQLKKKSVTDLLDLLSLKPLLDMKDCVIIDDQLAAIRTQGKLKY